MAEGNRYISPKDQERIAQFTRLRTVEFPKAIDAYLIFYSGICPDADEADKKKLKQKFFDELKDRKLMQNFIDRTREACAALLGLPENIELTVDPINLILVSAKHAKNPCVKTYFEWQPLFSRVVDGLDPILSRKVQSSLAKIYSRNYDIMQAHGANFTDAMTIFMKQPELFGFAAS